MTENAMREAYMSRLEDCVKRTMASVAGVSAARMDITQFTHMKLWLMNLAVRMKE
jgi:hypothetical protein